MSKYVYTCQHIPQSRIRMLKQVDSRLKQSLAFQLVTSVCFVEVNNLLTGRACLRVVWEESRPYTCCYVCVAVLCRRVACVKPSWNLLLIQLWKRCFVFFKAVTVVSFMMATVFASWDWSFGRIRPVIDIRSVHSLIRLLSSACFRFLSLASRALDIM